eukprot:TRINITY_DN1149_c0_g2_i1.p1 TRINITY_DN1149_c0_g2~~TRINITY_DN1149_c0_g2_i1.p1  ORF type:complete len:348 (-),score=69.43 TRINITY_DN1149_c0_g2_i1:299-1207(-)
MSDSEDRQAQADELLVLDSMYPDAFRRITSYVPTAPSYYEVDIDVAPEGSMSPLTLHWRYPADYPSRRPPTGVSVSAEWLSRTNAKRLCEALEARSERGSVVVYQWIEWLRENTVAHLGLEARLTDMSLADTVEDSAASASTRAAAVEARAYDGPAIVHGEPVTDRKSKFQAHLARVQSLEEIDIVMGELLSNKKIREATHNISAYRIRQTKDDGSVVMLENRDDDGETGAGDKVLYMMQMRNFLNVVVVVTRWYGGIQLGADRFKHITGCAADLLLKSLPPEKAPKDSDESSRKSKGKHVR